MEHTLQIAIQAALDAASHIVWTDALESQGPTELLEIPARAGWIETNLARTLADMASFRNVLVHGYTEVNLDIVRDVVAHGVDDLLRFVAVVRDRMP